MDEEKATAYYEEMRRKGVGAAKLKQGLGYGAPSSSSSQAASYSSFPSFVKGDSHAESVAKLEKESRLAAVRNKLKKRNDESDEYDHDARGHHEKRGRNRDGEQKSKDHGHPEKLRAGSRSLDREHTSKNERNHTRKRHRSCSSGSRSKEHRSQSRSPSYDSDYRSKRHSCQRCNSRSSSQSHSRERGGCSGDKRENRKRGSLQRARRRSRSPRRPSRRSRSASPRANSLDNHGHSCHNSGRDRHKSSHSSRRSRSPYVARQRKSESRKEDARSAKKPNTCDYVKLIPGFDAMTPAEKVREKMKLQLSETVSKDTAKGMDIEWERFVFNKNAPLDDDAKLDYFGDGTGAHDDTGFLQNTGSTFLSTCSQAKREAQIQAAHDAAIFGPFTGVSSKKRGSYGEESHDSPKKEADVDNDAVVQVEAAPSINNLVSDQVLTFQQGSWRERALRLKQQRATSTIS